MSFIDRIRSKIPLIDRLIDLSKRFSMPGFDGVSIFDVLYFLYEEIRSSVLDVQAKSIAFSFFLAIWPAVIFLFTLIAYVPIEGLQDNLVQLMEQVLPENAYELLAGTMIDIVSRQRTALLSFGFIFALYFTANGVVGLMDSFDRSYAIFHKRSFFAARAVAIKLTLMIFLLLLAALILIFAGNFILDFLLDYWDIKDSVIMILLNTIRWIVILALYFNVISVIYYYGPAVRKKWRFVSAGSTLATVLAIIISLLVKWFVNNFSTYNALYGSIGTILALLLWMYLNAYALLIGFELNTSIYVNKQIKSNEEEEGNSE